MFGCTGTYKEELIQMEESSSGVGLVQDIRRQKRVAEPKIGVFKQTKEETRA